MTPAARIQTAIEILDRVVGGVPAEQALTQWARASRFAGSGDRLAVRDHVYDALRRLRSYTALAGGGAPGGRVAMLGSLKAAGIEPASLFTGQGYAPVPMNEAENAAMLRAPELAALPDAVALDYPDWLETPLRDSLGQDFLAVMQAMQQRAPVILRVHARRGTREAVGASLAKEGIATKPHGLSMTALEVIDNERKVAKSDAYLSGLIELQDAAPQAAVEALPLRSGMRVLDYCAGGGGKVLAMAALVDAQFVAHDAAPARMRDLPDRARRAKASVRIVETDKLGEEPAFDLVLTDVPCSGTGTWRRGPDAKWTLTADRLAELQKIQAAILDAAADCVSANGYLAYMTCSLLKGENLDQITGFLKRRPGWKLLGERLFTPLEGGDGFYSALLTRG